MLFYFIHSSLVLFKQNVCYGINVGVNISMVQLNLYQFLHGYSTGEYVEFDSGAGMYLNHSIHIGLRLRHVPNVQGYFDGLLGDARQRTRYP